MMPSKTVNGKKFLILFMLGIVVFTILGGLGTWEIGQLTTPYFKAKAAEREKAQRTEAERATQRP